MRVELFINGQLTDLSEDIKITVDKVVSEYKDPLKKTGTYSLTVTLPYTHRNKAIFFHEDDKQILGKFRRTYSALLVVDDNLIIDGEFLHTKNSSKGFEGAVGSSRIRSPKLGDLLGDKTLRDIRSFEPLNFEGDTTVIDYMGRDLEFRPAGNPSTKRSELCFAHVHDSFRSLTQDKPISYEDLGLSHFCGTILEKILQDAGYSIIGNVVNNATFRKLIMLYSDSDNTQSWNYGTLTPGSAEMVNSGVLSPVYLPLQTHTYERQTDTVFTLRYPWSTNQGDLCHSIGSDGVYTCKYTGLYELIIKPDFIFQNGNGSTAASDSFHVFRCISDDEFMPEAFLPIRTGFSTPNIDYLDAGTLAVWTGNNVPHSITVRMEAGKQYEVQSYVSVDNTIITGTPSFYSNTPGGFRLVSCDGPLLVNPALFLPKMPQTDFVNAIFKIFNLYYQINEDLKAITLFTRDEFFSRSLGEVVDLTNQLSVHDLEESPLSSSEVAATYYRFKKDSSDFVLNRTDYLDLVNGDQLDGVYELPFAPLSFIQSHYELTDPNTNTTFLGVDFLPAIIPDEESEDISVLTNEDKVSQPGSWEPRICLYHGSKSFDPAIYAIPPVLPQSNRFYITLLGHPIVPPKLGFFNYTDQPVYKVEVNSTLRSFSLARSTDHTIYQANDLHFLRSSTTLAGLDGSSMAPNVSSTVNPKSLFFNLYANDLLIANLSNYLEGTGRMNAVLFNSLNGRQILRIDSDLYLLESIRGYELGSEKANYRIYKLITGAVTNLVAAGGTPGGATPATFNSTQSYTASCGSGFAGTDVTATYTADSNISQADADTLALQGARQAAEDGLVCLRTYTSTQSYTATCPQDYDGTPVTKTVTYISTISQDDADMVAAASAQVQALAELVCTYVGGGGDGGGGSYALTAGSGNDYAMPSSDFDGDFIIG